MAPFPVHEATQSSLVKIAHLASHLRRRLLLVESILIFQDPSGFAGTKLLSYMKIGWDHHPLNSLGFSHPPQFPLRRNICLGLLSWLVGVRV